MACAEKAMPLLTASNGSHQTPGREESRITRSGFGELGEFCFESSGLTASINIPQLADPDITAARLTACLEKAYDQAKFRGGEKQEAVMFRLEFSLLGRNVKMEIDGRSNRTNKNMPDETKQQETAPGNVPQSKTEPVVISEEMSPVLKKDFAIIDNALARIAAVQDRLSQPFPK